MSNSIFYIIMIFAGVGLAAILTWYFILSKRLNKEDLKYIKELKKGTQNNQYSLDVISQKLYVFYTKMPIIRTYLAKLRRRLEII